MTDMTEGVMRLGRVVLVVVVAMAAAGVVAAFAIAQSQDQSPPDAQDVPQVHRTGLLSEGEAPSGEPYSVFGLDAKVQGGACFEIAMASARAQTCVPMPQGNGTFGSTFAMLGENLFVLALADSEVEDIQVSRLDGVESSGPLSVIALDRSTRLLYRAVDAPQSTLPEVEPGHPVPPDVKVQTLDAAGDLIKSKDVRVPRPDDKRPQSGTAPPSHSTP